TRLCGRTPNCDACACVWALPVFVQTEQFSSQRQNGPSCPPGHRRARLRPRGIWGKAFSARLRQLRADEGLVGEALVEDALERQHEAPVVVLVPLVEAERLLVEVAEQVKRFNT